MLRRSEIGFGGYDAWTSQVYAEDARNANRMDAKLKIEAHWLERGVTARRKRNQGRLAKLWEMRAARAAMIALVPATRAQRTSAATAGFAVTASEASDAEMLADKVGMEMVRGA